MKLAKYQQGGFPAVPYYTGRKPGGQDTIVDLSNKFLGFLQSRMNRQDRIAELQLQHSLGMKELDRRNQLETELWEKKWSREDDVYRRNRIDSFKDQVNIFGKSAMLGAIKEANELYPDFDDGWEGHVFEKIQPYLIDQEMFEIASKDKSLDAMKIMEDYKSFRASGNEGKSFFESVDLPSYKLDASATTNWGTGNWGVINQMYDLLPEEEKAKITREDYVIMMSEKAQTTTHRNPDGGNKTDPKTLSIMTPQEAKESGMSRQEYMTRLASLKLNSETFGRLADITDEVYGVSPTQKGIKPRAMRFSSKEEAKNYIKTHLAKNNNALSREIDEQTYWGVYNVEGLPEGESREYGQYDFDSFVDWMGGKNNDDPQSVIKQVNKNGIVHFEIDFTKRDPNLVGYNPVEYIDKDGNIVQDPSGGSSPQSNVDCPDLGGNVGDSCPLGNGVTGVITSDCQCQPVAPGALPPSSPPTEGESDITEEDAAEYKVKK